MEKRFVSAAQTNHCVVYRRVSVRIELHRRADDIGAFCAVSAEKPHLVHGEQKLSVRRLEAVDLRDRTGNDDAHRVGHIVCLDRFGYRLHYRFGIHKLDRLVFLLSRHL